MKTSDMNRHNVFDGPNSVLDFLNPDKNPPTPLVEIPRELNPYFEEGVKIYAKLMNFNGLGNIKSLPALRMLKNLIKEKKAPDTIIENSSGNTVYSMAVIGRLLGIKTTKAYVSHEVSWGKLQLLRLMGTHTIVNEEPICPDPDDKQSGIYKAKQMANQKGWSNPGQYDNEDNPISHYEWTGPQVWKQTKGKIDVFCAGMGTTGTLCGAGKYLKEKSKKVINVGVIRMPNNPVPGVRTQNLLKQIAFDWKNNVDELVSVGTIESFKKSLELCRYGIMVGPSSGFAFQGLVNYLAKIGKKRRNMVCVFVCCDSPLPYLSEYFEYLDDSHFPKIENEELLINKQNYRFQKSTDADVSSWEIDPMEALNTAYLSKGVDRMSVIDGVEILDVRTNEEYQDAHLPGSINIDHMELLEKIEEFSKKLDGKRVYCVCRSGRRSGLVTEALRKRNIEAFNIKGGMIEWSQLDYPRIRPEYCKT